METILILAMILIACGGIILLRYQTKKYYNEPITLEESIRLMNAYSLNSPRRQKAWDTINKHLANLRTTPCYTWAVGKKCPLDNVECGTAPCYLTFPIEEKKKCA